MTLINFDLKRNEGGAQFDDW